MVLWEAKRLGFCFLLLCTTRNTSSCQESSRLAPYASLPSTEPPMVGQPAGRPAFCGLNWYGVHVFMFFFGRGTRRVVESLADRHDRHVRPTYDTAGGESLQNDTAIVWALWEGWLRWLRSALDNLGSDRRIRNPPRSPDGAQGMDRRAPHRRFHESGRWLR